MDLQKSIKSVQTTAIGLLTGLILSLSQLLYFIDGDPETDGSIALFMAGLGMMGLGVVAKDGDV